MRSPAEIEKYLRYLKEVSRKIATGVGFEKIILKTGSKALDPVNAQPNLVRQLIVLDECAHRQSPLFEHYKHVSLHLEKNVDSRYYLGFGLLAGLIPDSYTKSYLAAPILLIQMEISPFGPENMGLQNDKKYQDITTVNDSTQNRKIYSKINQLYKGYELNFDFSTLSLNYDALSQLTNLDFSEEDNELSENTMVQLDAFDEIESLTEQFFPPGCNAETINQELLRHYALTRWGIELNKFSFINLIFEFLFHLANEIFEICKIYLPGLKKFSELPVGKNINSISVAAKELAGYYSGGYHLEDELIIWNTKKTRKKSSFRKNDEKLTPENSNLLLSIFETPLCYAPSCHGFIARQPNSLSTYKSLEALINEITSVVYQTEINISDSEKFQSQKSSFYHSALYKLLEGGKNEMPEEISHSWLSSIEKLPIQLSENQIAAIHNAITEPLSYIQGPPGTGKSHVITALMLAALLSGKKALLVSQKEAALDVVKSKINDFFPLDNQNLIPYLEPICYVERENIEKAGKKSFRSYTGRLLEISQNKKENERKFKEAQLQLKQLENKILEIKNDILNLKNKLDHYILLDRQFNLELIKIKTIREEIYEKYNLHIPEIIFEKNDSSFPFKYHKIDQYPRYCFLLDRMEELQKKPLSLIGKFHIKKLEHHFLTTLGADPKIFMQYRWEYARDLINLYQSYTKASNLQNQFLHDANNLKFERLEYKRKNKNLVELNKTHLRLFQNYQLIKVLLSTEHIIELDKFDKMLHWRNPSIISKKQKEINWNILTEILPLWAIEIRLTGQILPHNADMFDFVIVDEASQVNLAEILPIFYRGKNIVIVGDHAQLGLNSTGLNFQLSKKYDVLIWNKLKPFGLNYSQAREHNLTVTDSSILDYLRSKTRNISFPQQMLNEHFRSQPQLANFTGRFYENNSSGIKWIIMNQNPVSQKEPQFDHLEVNGIRNEQKINIEEVQLIFETVKSIVHGKKTTSQKLNLFIEKIKNIREEEVYSTTTPPILTLGIITVIRNQAEFILENISEYFNPEEQSILKDRFDLLVGTPEEFQGNERDLMILSLGIDESCTHSSAHYQNNRRFNVMTGRAKYFNLLISGKLPPNFHLWKEYIKSFEINTDIISVKKEKLNIPETILFDFLVGWINKNSAQGSANTFKLHENFSILNLGKSGRGMFAIEKISSPSQWVAIEFECDFYPNPYESQDHFLLRNDQREQILQRARWQIIKTPLAKWFNNGYYIKGNESSDSELAAEKRNLENELNKLFDL